MCKPSPCAQEGRDSSNTPAAQSNWRSLAAPTPQTSPALSGRTTIPSSATPTAQSYCSAINADLTRSAPPRSDNASPPLAAPPAAAAGAPPQQRGWLWVLISDVILRSPDLRRCKLSHVVSSAFF